MPVFGEKSASTAGTFGSSARASAPESGRSSTPFARPRARRVASACTLGVLDRDDELADPLVRDAVTRAELVELRVARHAEPRLQRAGGVVHPGVDDLAVAAGLLGAVALRALEQHEVREEGGQAGGDRQTDDARPDDRHPRVGHGAILNALPRDECATVTVPGMPSAPSTLLIALAALGCAGRPSPSGASASPAPAGGAPRVLFVGNSLTEGNALPAMVEALARAAGQPLAAEAVTFGGFSLEDHWNQGDARRAIGRGGLRFVVLQQGPSSLAESRANLLVWTAPFRGGDPPCRRAARAVLGVARVGTRGCLRRGDRVVSPGGGQRRRRLCCRRARRGARPGAAPRRSSSTAPTASIRRRAAPTWRRS